MRISTVLSARGIVTLIVALAAIAGPATAQQTPPQAQQPQKEHVVKKGDTLWDIARFYFNDPFRWPLIYDANRNVVRNPHWIYPAEKLVIPGTLSNLLGTSVAVDSAPSGIQRSRFYGGPVDTTTRATLISSERDRLRLVQPLEWQAAPWIADSAQLGINAVVYKPIEPRDQGDKLVTMFHPRDRLYMSLMGTGVKKGDRLLALRLTHHQSLLGYGDIVEPMGILRVDSVSGNTALVMVVNQFGDLKTGDLAMPLPATPSLPIDQMTEVSGGPTGEIIDFMIRQPLYSTQDIAFVNLGAGQGITIGDELLAYVAGRKLSEKSPEVLPDEPVAEMRVVRVTDKTATVRVTGLKNTALERGLPVRVARKAP